MLVFRSVLLWLAFLFILLGQFVEKDTINLLLFYGLTPAALLFIWVITTLFFNKKLVVNTTVYGTKILKIIKVLRFSASIFITVGAVIKILKWNYGDLLLMLGIGFMAAYSSVLAYVAKTKNDPNPEIIDDL